MFKAAAHNDPNITPVAAVQPDQALALHHGEVLSLNSSPKSTRTIKSVASSALGLVIFTLIGMSLPVALLPAFNPLQWLEAEAATPSLTDWMAFFYPLVLVLIFVCSGFASAISGKAKYIVADDDGVSVVRTRGRRRFIPWHDILVFLHPLTGSGELPTGGYFLWGREHGLIVSIPNRKKRRLRLLERSRSLSKRSGHLSLMRIDYWQLLLRAAISHCASTRALPCG